jgi:hypothetical protein
MFKWIINYLGFLKDVPLLPHMYDGVLRVITLIRNRELARSMEEIEEEVSSWPSVTVHFHKYGGTQFDVNGKEIGHIHHNGLLDALFNLSVKQELIKNKRAVDHHTFVNSGWISFYMHSSSDKENALQLLRQSYEMKTKT